MEKKRLGGQGPLSRALALSHLLSLTILNQNHLPQACQGMWVLVLVCGCVEVGESVGAAPVKSASRGSLTQL